MLARVFWEGVQTTYLLSGKEIGNALMSEGICGCLEKQGSDAQREVGRGVTGGGAGRGANVGRGGSPSHEKKLSAS